MKIGQQSYYSAVVGVVSLAGLIIYAPELQAEEAVSISSQENQLEPIEQAILSPSKAFELDNSLNLASNNATQSPKSFNGDSSNLTLSTNQQAWLTPFTALADSRLKDNLPPSTANYATTLGPALEVAGNTNPSTNAVDKSDWPSPIEDTQIYSFVLFDQLEYRNSDGGAFNWEGLGWVGGDFNRLWFKTQGEVGFKDGAGNAELQVLYGRLISPFFDFQVGVRYDRLFGSNSNRGRAFGVIGIQGIAPYLFDIEASLFISEDGDVSARFSTLYNWRLTQRLVLQPSFEVNLAAQQVRDFNVGSGFNDIELGLRLRYEITRKFGPYIGVSWTRQLGRTADFARQDGENVDDLTFVTGLRLFF